ncbi:hypothetical protein OBBRIDRAFT_798222 [Obba rivulosa]|uniref:Uncharacterized protein n=1 Tax=Obba rivulosa TaxID=1052685 RepID=A0A8E2AP58_9APHY|nr:hypothetical protein OBBRIDRAFT_798222 [Obba rivulosa]
MCTTGRGLSPAHFEPRAFATLYPSNHPSNLANLIRQVLLLIPFESHDMFRAMWYLRHLPIFFGPVQLSLDKEHEMRFRDELLGGISDWELDAALRLVILGYMLSTKSRGACLIFDAAWRQVFDIPIQALVRLEHLATQILNRDLSISEQQWEQWLAYLHTFQLPPSPQTTQQIIPVIQSAVIGQELERLLQHAQSTEHSRYREPGRHHTMPVPAVPATRRRSSALRAPVHHRLSGNLTSGHWI